MANKPEIRYINYYTSGSAAYQLSPKPEKKKVQLPKPRTRPPRQLVIQLDPVALAGIVVAAALVIMIAVGMVNLSEQQKQTQLLQTYVEQLKAENQQLQDTYAAGYDLEEVEKIALSLGMVPGDTVTSQTIHVVVPQVPAEPSAWENFVTFLTGLFA